VKKLWFCIIALLALTSFANAEKVYYIRHSPGGKISEHYFKYQRVASQYDRVEITGMCKSACTMVLGIVPLERICITPSGYFMFHAAYDRNRVRSERDTQTVLAAYAPSVKAWVEKHRALDAVAPYTYLYAKSVTFIRHCSPSKPRPEKDR
jgi:hypothetical protein